MDNNDGDFVTRAECVASRKEVVSLVTNIRDDVRKHGKALYGDDGRGGIQRDMTITKDTVERIEETLNGKKELVVRNKEISVKRLMVYITVVCTILTAVIGPIVVTVVQHVLNKA